MRRVIPPISALIAFEAAARRRNFSRAAEELSLTQGAVSRQIASLEKFVGVLLFERKRQRVALTEAGQFYAQEIGAVLNRLAVTTSEVAAYRQGRVLKLATPPSFGTHWLVPRLKGFVDRHPNIAVTLSDWVKPTGFEAGTIDLAIHFGDVIWPGMEACPLLAEDVIPVAAPGLIARLGLRSPEDLLRASLLVQETRPQLWNQWFASHSLEDFVGPARLTFSHFAMVVQAAMAEMGVAIAPILLMEQQLKLGLLVPLCGPPMRSKGHYQLIFPSRPTYSSEIIAFRDWIRTEAVSSSITLTEMTEKLGTGVAKVAGTET